MSGESFVWWLVLALMVCWAVGVYNRLTRMRARALEALGSLDKQLKAYRALLVEHWSEMGVQLATPTAASWTLALPALWAGLLSQLDELEVASRQARMQGPSIESLRTVSVSLVAVDRLWQDLCREPDDLTGPVVPPQLQHRWLENTARVEAARSYFNQIHHRYNEAIAQFPASVLARTMRFAPVATL